MGPRRVAGSEAGLVDAGIVVPPRGSVFGWGLPQALLASARSPNRARQPEGCPPAETGAPAVGGKMCLKVVQGPAQTSAWDACSQQAGWVVGRWSRLHFLGRCEAQEFLTNPLLWGITCAAYWPMVVTLAHQKPSLKLPHHVDFPQFCCRYLCPQILLEIVNIVTGCL